jgi:phosphate transport system substrate-binding protein
MQFGRPWGALLAPFAVLLLLSGCRVFNLPVQDKNSRSLTAAGATFPYPLYSRWFDIYKKRSGLAINYQANGSGAGIAQLEMGTIDFAASDAPLSDAQLREMPAPIVQLPTVAGAIALAYH